MGQSAIQEEQDSYVGSPPNRTNCIALVNTCRDEVCRPLATFIDEEFGLSFNLSGLGGLINSGKTGFGAGMSHSPEFPCDISGKPRERCEAVSSLLPAPL